MNSLLASSRHLGRVTEITDALTGRQTVVQDIEYNANGLRERLAVTVGGTDDLQNDYVYDRLNRLTRITQQGQSGGNAVAEKRVDFVYDLLGRSDTIARYKDVDGGGGNLVAESDYDFDLQSRLTDLEHLKPGDVTVDHHQYEYDAAGRITSYTNTPLGETTYTYDNTGQLTGADYSAVLTDESYAYDENGNRLSGNGESYTNGDDNQLDLVGNYDYDYDAEGNLVCRLNTTDDTSVVYTFDHRNRLVKIEFLDDESNVTSSIDYLYDALNRRIARIYDANGPTAGGESSQFYAYDGTDVLLDLYDADGSDIYVSPVLWNRYLWNPNQSEDQLLAQEYQGATQEVWWALPDRQGSVREYILRDDDAVVQNSYYTFGSTVTAVLGSMPSAGALPRELRYQYTCQENDSAAALMYYDARWYDTATGKFMSQDPLGFSAGDESLYRYVGNNPLIYIDPWGLLKNVQLYSHVAWYIRTYTGGPWYWKDWKTWWVGSTRVTSTLQVDATSVTYVDSQSYQSPSKTYKERYTFTWVDVLFDSMGVGKEIKCPCIDSNGKAIKGENTWTGVFLKHKHGISLNDRLKFKGVTIEGGGEIGGEGGKTVGKIGVDITYEKPKVFSIYYFQVFVCPDGKGDYYLLDPDDGWEVRQKKPEVTVSTRGIF